MKQVLQDMNSGQTYLEDAPAPELLGDSIKIATDMTLISAGTEKMLVGFGKASYIDKARQQPERVQMVLDKVATDGFINTFDAVRSKLSQPLPLGYSNVGIVQQISPGVTEFRVGDRVVSNGPHADVITVKKNLCAVVPDNVDNEAAVFTVVGSISLQGVRLAEPTIGEAFVVFGAGLIGLLTIQVLRANGCRVLAIDVDDEKLALAEQFGAEVFNPKSGKDVLNYSSEFSRGRGVDGVIIAASSQSNDLVKQAAKMCRKRGRIVLIGVVGLSLDRADFYEKEISFQVSCSYGPGRYDKNYEDLGMDYPIGYVRWTEQRNFEAFLDLLATGAVDTQPLISSRFEFCDAVAAYDELISNSSSIGIILNYKSSVPERMKQKTQISEISGKLNDIPVIGFIGAGNYASRQLIPAFKKTSSKLHTLVTANGLNSVSHGKKAGFLYASTDIKNMIDDSDINTIVIATRHDSHSEYVTQSLKSGKHVWVEKPLALDFKGVSSVEKAFRNAHQIAKDLGTGPQLMVGFNRRFSPLVEKMRTLLAQTDGPYSLIITVNAGFISADHWTQDISKGGGRIIGEACHFIDLMRFLVGSKISHITGSSMKSRVSDKPIVDNSSITLSFEDGSFGTILYLANGSSKFPKERIEVFTEGKVLQIDNFRTLRGFGWKGFRNMNLWSQDKGQKACATAFVKSLQSGVPCIPVDEIFEVAYATIDANEILLNQQD